VDRDVRVRVFGLRVLIRVGVVVATIILGRDLHRADSEDGRQPEERPDDAARPVHYPVVEPVDDALIV
jgi:hypothetical protein